MFLKHVVITFKRQWIRFVLLGLLLVLSSFSYVSVNVSTRSIQESAVPFFESTNQEDFTVYTNPFMTLEEIEDIQECVGVINPLIIDIHRNNLECYNAILDYRINQLSERFDDLDFAYRFYKDLRFNLGDSTHTIRVLKDSSTINQSLITDGVAPDNDFEIAISKNYALNNDLSIGDTIALQDVSYTITGFVLFPDYNLPILDQIYLFDTASQTLGLMTDSAFNDLNSVLEHYLTGVFTEGQPEDFNSEVAAFEFVTFAVLTENNVRSGAIYAEIEAGQGTGLMLSILVAFIGIMIVIVMIVKSLEQSRGAIGIFKALGGKVSEMMVPYLLALTIFALFFLSIGVYLGYLAAPWLSNLYLMFYLLPESQEKFIFSDITIAIFGPLLTVLLLSTLQLRKMMRQEAMVLMKPKVTTVNPQRFRKIRKIFQTLDIKNRIQIAFLLRQSRKVIIYAIGVISALFLMFLSLGMVNVFDQSVIDYYEQSSIESIVYCETFDCDPKEYDKVLELPVVIDNIDATLIGIDINNSTRTLYNSRGNALNASLEDGIVITRSFADLSRLSVGDVVLLKVANESINIEVVGIADLYPGNTVFYQREKVSELLFDTSEYFNRLYSATRIEDEEYDNVAHIDVILEQIGYVNELVESMMYFIMVSAGIMALIIIYLLTVLSVEDQTYEISLFKVIGYDSKEISRMVLGGYKKLNILLFFITIPITILAFYILRIWMIREFNFYIPMTLQVWHLMVAFIVFIAVYLLATLRAKHNVAKRSLQEALKITQI